MIPRFAIGSLVVALLAASPVRGAEKVDYLKQIKPLLKKRCMTCHGPLRRRGGLRLDAAKLIRKGGDSGPALVPGKPDESLIVGVLTGAGGYTRMPKDGKPLQPAEIALIRRWVRDGAVAPNDEPVAADPHDHWAFRVPQRPAVPRVKNRKWVRNPIDAFLAAQHERRGLKPQPEAAKNILLRRVYLDLIGLPPTPEELQAFLNDSSPDAYEKVVDRLLKSPRYGERWGRHWMDVWRYSDWYGYRKELRNSWRHIWRWRDYIVESLNRDRPYAEMIVDMLAADENTPTDRDRLRATGFLARHYYKFNRDVWLDSAVEHTGKAFLGLTVNCCRCHEHKYDPLEQRDYYEFRAIFEPYRVRSDRVPGEPDVNKDALALAYDAKPDVKTFVYERGNDKHPLKDDPVSPELPDFFAGKAFRIQPVKLPPEMWYPGMRSYVRKELLAGALAVIKQKRSALRAARTKTARTQALKAAQAELRAAEAAWKSLQARIAADDARYAEPPAASAKQLIAAASRAEKVAKLHAAQAAVARAQLNAQSPPKRKKGKKAAAKLQTPAAAKKKLAAAQAALKNDDGKYSPLTETYPQTSTGRRLALAKWIASRHNPLTARVAVNHIWARHFGSPLVSTMFDFGLNGKPPTHPQLLDWLAVEFMQGSRAGGQRPEVRSQRSEIGGHNGATTHHSPLTTHQIRNSFGWSMKHIHRLIVTSSAYRMSSSTRNAGPRNLAIDQDNRFLWRMNSRRMEAEIVRDSALWVAGSLDLTMGGPELDAKLGQTTYRRSLYYRHAPEKFMPFLQIFDGASTHECYRRSETVVPQQSLAMINSGLMIEQSRRLAALLDRSAKTDADYVERLFLRVLCRPPTDAERKTCLDFLASQTRRLKQPGRLSTFVGGTNVKTPPSNDPRIRARENLAHVLLNHNEFVTVR